MKNRITTGILAILLGWIGGHYFYLNQSGKGILCLLFWWTGIPAIIGLIEGVMILCMSDEEFIIKYYNEESFSKTPSKIENNATQVVNVGNTDKAGQLKTYLELFEKGAISQEEFDKKKSEILNN